MIGGGIAGAAGRIAERGISGVKASELQQIAKRADDACGAAIEHPSDRKIRKTLFEAMAALIDPAFLALADGGPPHLRGRCRQACILAESVRERIDASCKPGVPDGSASMGIAILARDLRRVLADIVDWGESRRNA